MTTTHPVLDQRAALDAALADLDPQPQPEHDDDARYWLTARGLGQLRTGSGLDTRVAHGLIESDPDAIVGYFPEWEAWDRVR